MSRIRSLKPNVTREEAVRQFSGGPLSLLRNLALGPVRSVGDAYIPFRLFEVNVSHSQGGEKRFLALDAVDGSLDLYHFDQIPSLSDVIVLETRNCLAAAMDESQAARLVTEKFSRLLFQRGFFRLRRLRISSTALPGEIHIPYWLGFRGHGRRVRVEVMDAVRRRYEGAKVRKLLENWLASGA